MAYVSGEALITVRGTLQGSEEWANTWCVADGTGSGDPQDIADALHEFYETLLEGATGFYNAGVTADEIRYHDLFTNNDVAVTWTALEGVSGSESLPPECAIRVSIQSATRRGGPFLPAFVIASVTQQGQLDTIYATALAVALDELWADVAATGSVIALHSPKDDTTYEVIAAKVGHTFDVIRNRRNQLPEGYVAITIP